MTGRASDPTGYPDAGLDGNYCRNPDLTQPEPWCYVYDSTSPYTWETCEFLTNKLEYCASQCMHKAYVDRDGGTGQFYMDNEMTTCECCKSSTWAASEGKMAFTIQPIDGYMSNASSRRLESLNPESALRVVNITEPVDDHDMIP